MIPSFVRTAATTLFLLAGWQGDDEHDNDENEGISSRSSSKIRRGKVVAWSQCWAPGGKLALEVSE